MDKPLRSVIKLFIIGYFSCFLVGWLILRLPLCQNLPIPSLDVIFTAASAISTTGLVTLDIGQVFNFHGQLVLLMLIQLGGIGYMVFSSWVLLNLNHSPFNFARLIKQILLFTLICEAIGCGVLYFLFKHDLWTALFHCISAFCTAGFSLFSTNLEGFKDNAGVNITLSLLSILGAFGFFWTTQLSLKSISPILRSFTTALIVIGTLFFVMTAGDWDVLVSFFQTVTALTTAGFNTVNMKFMSGASMVCMIILMLFGATLTSRNRNIKGTSLLTIAKLLIPKERSHRNFKALWQRMQIVASTFFHFLFVLSVSMIVFILIEKQAFLPLLFEAASALCTIGLSTGITPELTLAGKSLLIFLMLVGRVGILIFGFVTSMQLIARERREGVNA